MTARSETQANHFLDRLAARIQGDPDLLEPRRPSLFEPNAGQHDTQEISLSDKAPTALEQIRNQLSGNIFQKGPLQELHDSGEVNDAAPGQTREAGNETRNEGVEPSVRAKSAKQFESQLALSNQRPKAARVPQNSTKKPVAETFEIAYGNKPAHEQAGPQREDQLPAGMNRLAPKTLKSPDTVQIDGGNIAHISGPVRVARQRQSSAQGFAPPLNKSNVPRPSALSEFAAPESESIVNITIGRLEVRAVHQQQPFPPPRARASTPLSLDAYLKSKAGKA
jgi:hypothetical protein